MVSVIQSVVFRKPISIGEAKQHLASMGLKYSKHDVTPNTIRFRQHDPKILEHAGYRFRNKEFKYGYLVLAIKA